MIILQHLITMLRKLQQKLFYQAFIKRAGADKVKTTTDGRYAVLSYETV